jgi:O-antigen ligase
MMAVTFNGEETSGALTARKRGFWREPLNIQFVLFLMLLTAFTDVKLGPVQVSEVVALLGLLFVGPSVLFRSRLPSGKLDRLALVLVFLFFAIVIFGAAASYYTQAFFPPSDVQNLLRQPGWISSARIFQLFLAYSCFAILVFYTSRDKELVAKCVRMYIYALTLSAIYGIVSWLLLAGANIKLGGAYGESGARLRAFFVEGGPFGLYAASGLLLVVAQWRWAMIPKKRVLVCTTLILVALLLAQSKSAVFAMIVTMTVGVLFSGLKNIQRYFIPFTLAVLSVSVLAVFAGAGSAFDAIMSGRSALVSTPDLVGDDLNVIAGRIAGSLIVPEMIMAHPIIGVGVGNYSLLRNSPQYNTILPSVDLWDLHGLGLYGFTAEVGIVGCLLFAMFFLVPALMARSRRAPFGLIMLCCFPLIAFVFGVQPTFLYPWVVCGLGIAMLRQFVRKPVK